MIFYYCLAIFFEKIRIMYYRRRKQIPLFAIATVGKTEMNGEKRSVQSSSLTSFGISRKMYKRTTYCIGRLNNLYIFAPSK